MGAADPILAVPLPCLVCEQPRPLKTDEAFFFMGHLKARGDLGRALPAPYKV